MQSCRIGPKSDNKVSIIPYNEKFHFNKYFKYNSKLNSLKDFNNFITIYFFSYSKQKLYLIEKENIS